MQAAVVARIDLVQIREKNLSASVLYQLAKSSANLATRSTTKILINDRSDIAAAAGADGVHLTTSSLPTAAVRQTFGDRFLVGVSTHSLEEASLARNAGADFVVFGPVFETAAKSSYGEPAGLTSLATVCSQLAPFPVFALGGVTMQNARECVSSGARGIAAIRMLQQPDRLAEIVAEIRTIHDETRTETKSG